MPLFAAPCGPARSGEQRECHQWHRHHLHEAHEPVRVKEGWCVGRRLTLIDHSCKSARTGIRRLPASRKQSSAVIAAPEDSEHLEAGGPRSQFSNSSSFFKRYIAPGSRRKSLKLFEYACPA
jgi:hypothetical protein